MLVSDDELGRVIATHVRHDPKVTDAQRTSNISVLNGLISRLERFLANMVERRGAPVRIDSEDRVSHSYYNVVCQLRGWIADVSDAAFQYQLTEFQKTLYLAQQIRDYVVNTPHTLGNCDDLESATRKKVTTDGRYQRLRFERIRYLSKAGKVIENHLRTSTLSLLQREVLTAVANYEPTISYSRPGPFDSLLEEYVHSTPELAALVLPAAMVVAEGTPLALLATLSEFNVAVMTCLKITSAPARAVVYTSLVRFLFGVAYTLNWTELSGDMEQNISFLKTCDRFASQTVRELVLTKVITKNFTPGLPVASMFKSKQVNMLKPMEVMTNPIDLMYYVHQILGTLATCFAAGEHFLSFDDILTLLLALLSLSPPVNAIAIAAFVQKWESVQLSSVVSVAKNYFVAAVEQIQIFGQDHVK
jgi:hypothetical protein